MIHTSEDEAASYGFATKSVDDVLAAAEGMVSQSIPHVFRWDTASLWPLSCT